MLHLWPVSTECLRTISHNYKSMVVSMKRVCESFEIYPWGFPAKREMVTTKALQQVKLVVMYPSADWGHHGSVAWTTRETWNVDMDKQARDAYLLDWYIQRADILSHSKPILGDRQRKCFISFGTLTTDQTSLQTDNSLHQVVHGTGWRWRLWARMSWHETSQRMRTCLLITVIVLGGAWW